MSDRDETLSRLASSSDTSLVSRLCLERLGWVSFSVALLGAGVYFGKRYYGNTPDQSSKVTNE
jgi:hypothetical protein